MAIDSMVNDGSFEHASAPFNFDKHKSTNAKKKLSKKPQIEFSLQN